MRLITVLTLTLFMFTTSQMLPTDKKFHSNITKTKVAKCPICGRKYSNVNTLSAHLRKNRSLCKKYRIITKANETSRGHYEFYCPHGCKCTESSPLKIRNFISHECPDTEKDRSIYKIDSRDRRNSRDKKRPRNTTTFNKACGPSRKKTSKSYKERYSVVASSSKDAIDLPQLLSNYLKKQSEGPEEPISEVNTNPNPFTDLSTNQPKISIFNRFLHPPDFWSSVAQLEKIQERREWNYYSSYTQIVCGIRVQKPILYPKRIIKYDLVKNFPRLIELIAQNKKRCDTMLNS